MPTIRELHNKGVRKIRRIDELNGRYISCSDDAFYPDALGEMTLFYCNLHTAHGLVIKYGLTVNLDKEGYCEI